MLELEEKIVPWLPQMFIIASICLTALLTVKLLRLEVKPILLGSSERTNEEAKGIGFFLLAFSAIICIGTFTSIFISPFVEKTPSSPVPSLELTFISIVGFAAFFLIRIFVNSFLSFVSSSKGLAGSLNRVELRTISLLGLVSIPLLFFYTFYYSDVKALYTAFIVILLVVYLIRLFLLFTSASEHGIPVEYIFLYLCTLEITPLIAVGLWFTGAERVL